MFTYAKYVAAGTEKEHHRVSSGETDPQTIHHHRDDGITGIPRHQLNDTQTHINHPNDQVPHDEMRDRGVQPPGAQRVSSSGPRPDPAHHRDEVVSGILQDQPNNTQADAKSPNGQPKVVLPRQDNADPSLVAHGAPAPIN